MEELRLVRQSVSTSRGGLDGDALRQLRDKYERDRAEMAAENERLQVALKALHAKHVEALERQTSERSASGREQGAVAAQAREVAALQARLDAASRRAADEARRRDELSAENRRLADLVRSAQQERAVLETRMDHIVNQIRKEQELDLGGPLRSAVTQQRRTNEQIGEMTSLVGGGGGGAGGGAMRAAPLAGGSADRYADPTRGASAASSSAPPPPRRPPNAAPLAQGAAPLGAMPPTGASGSHWRP
jgi:hypothetical protein